MMKKLFWTTITVAVACALALSSCGTVKNVTDKTTDLVTGSKPESESEWNSERLWRRVGDDPPTYVPAAYTSESTENGEWFTDKRDGKRLFVPSGGAEGLPESVLRAEAWMATGKGKRPFQTQI